VGSLLGYPIDNIEGVILQTYNICKCEWSDELKGVIMKLVKMSCDKCHYEISEYSYFIHIGWASAICFM
jgi:hypothetical protein